MKKVYLIFVGMVLASMCMQAAVRYNLSPVGFEEGVIPATWTQEQREGAVPWIVEGGMGVSMGTPTGAAEGVYRAAIRRPNGSSEHFVTRLISPSFDLTTASMPELVFSHAQVAASGYLDTLRVYYRVDASSAWKLLREYVSEIPMWTTEHIQLPADYLHATAYQLAFEVSDAVGKGVVLDNIYVHEPSTCRPPLFAMVQPTSEGAYFYFQSNGSGVGSKGTFFDLVISKTELTDPAIALTTDIAYAKYQFSELEMEVNNLTSNTDYYAYLRTNCEDNATGYTEWVQTKFHTNMLVNVPYIETFNAGDGGDYVTPAGWITGTDIDEITVPFAYVGALYRYREKYSSDTTGFLAFASTHETFQPIMQGQYAYAASPEINANLSQCEVAFDGSAYTWVADGTNDYAAEIMVGVMENPLEWSTFEPIKTVKVESSVQFKHFTISLADYTGTAKHIALASAASADNAFYVDNFQVYTPAVRTPENVLVSNITPTGFDVQATLHGADSWNVKVANHFVNNGNSLKDTDCWATVENSKTNIVHVNLPQGVAGSVVTIYVQAQKGGAKSAWAFPVTLRVPTEAQPPFEMSFEEGTYSPVPLVSLNNAIHFVSDDLWAPDCIFFSLRSLDGYYPTVSSEAPIYEGAHLVLNGVDDYFTLPYIARLDTLELYFRLSATGAGRLAVGVMENPYDLSTFVSVATFDGNTLGYELCNVPFSSYQGSGHYIAFRAVGSSANAKVSCNHIDAIRLGEPDCGGMKSLFAIATGTTTAQVDWEVRGKASVDIEVYDVATETMVFSNTYTTTPITLTNLIPNTEYEVRAHQSCESEANPMMARFRTECAAVTPDQLGVVRFNTADDLFCWEVGIYVPASSSSAAPPSVVKDAFFGRVLQMKKQANTETQNYGNSYYAIMPELQVDDIRQWQVMFEAATNMQDTVNVKQLYVGITFNTTDLSALEVIDTIPLQYAADSTDLRSYAISFDQYEGDYLGRQGKYVVFMINAPEGYSDIAILDNVRIVPAATCHQVVDLAVSSLSAHTASLTWSTTTSESEFILFDKRWDGSADMEPVVRQVVQGTRIDLTKLQNSTDYFAYVRPICGVGDTAIWSAHTRMKTLIGIPYEEPVERTTKLQTEGWKVYSGNALGADTFDVSQMSYSTASYAWKVASTEQMSRLNGMSEYALRAENYYEYKTLLVSPDIEIEHTEYDNARLSFILARTHTYNSSWDLGTGVSQSFYLMIQREGEAIWEPANALASWRTDGKGDYDFNALGYDAVRYTFNLSEYVGSTIRLGFFSKAELNYDNADFHLWIDSLLLTQFEPVCVGNIQTQLGEVGYHSVHLDFQPFYSTDTIEYRVELNGAVERVGKTDSLKVDIVGLTPDTYYRVFARSLCALGDTSAWYGPIAFTTECLTTDQTVYTFDSQSSHRSFDGGTMEKCWSVMYDDAWYAPCIMQNDGYNSITYSHSGEYALYFHDRYDHKSTVVMAPMEEDLDTMALVFWARSGYQRGSGSSYSGDSYNHAIQVGTMTDPNDLSSFQLIQTVAPVSITQSLSAYPDNGWEQIIVPLRGATGKYVALHNPVNKSGKSTYLAIDDVQICRMPCALVKNFRVEQVTHRGATLRWESEADSFLVTIVADHFEKQYTAKGDSLVIDDIVPDLYYTASVVSVCDRGTGFAKTLSFTTLRAIPFTEDFALTDYMAQHGWTQWTGDILNGGALSKSIVKDWVWTNTDAAGIASSKVIWKITKNGANNTPQEQHTILMSPAIWMEVDESGKALLSFDLSLTATDSTRCEGRRFAVLVSTDDGATWDIANAIMWDSTATADLAFADIPDTSTHYTFDLSAYNGRTIRMAFYASSPATQSAGYLHLDNISLAANYVGCEAPEDLSAEEYETGKIAFSWHGDREMTYELQISLNSKFMGILHADTIHGATTDTLSLEGSTPYYARVRVICGETLTNWTSCTFVTRASLPFLETFSAPLSEMVWTRYADVVADSLFMQKQSFSGDTPLTGDDWTTNSIYNNRYALDDEHHISVEFYGSANNTWLLSPQIALPFVAGEEHIYYSMDIALTKYNSGEAYTPTKDDAFLMAVSLDGGVTWNKEDAIIWKNGDSESTYALSDIPNGKGTSLRLDFTKYQGHTIQIAWGIQSSYDGMGRLHIDNVSLLSTSSRCLCGSEVRITEITPTSARLTFNSENPAVEWGCRLVADGDSSSAVDTVVSAASAENGIVVSGLLSNTSYQVYVRSICAEGDSSVWSGPFVFRTGVQIPYMQDFTATYFPAEWKRYEDISPTDIYATSSAFATRGENPTEGGWNVHNSTSAFQDDAHASARMGYYTYSWMVSPVFDLSQCAEDDFIALSFDAALTADGSMAKPYSPESFAFYVMLSIDGGKTWKHENTILWSEYDASAKYKMSSIPTGNGQHYTISLNDYIGLPLQVAFGACYVSSSTTARLHIDNIAVGTPAVTCLGVEQVCITNCGADFADITFKRRDKANQWEYVLDIDAVDTLTATPQGVDSLSFRVDNLLPNTAYQLYMRSVCSETEHSAWAGPFQFTTALPIPFCEPLTETSLFDGTWTSYSASFRNTNVLNSSELVKSNKWKCTKPEAIITGMGSCAARIELYGSGDYDALLVSPLLAIPDDIESAQLTFRAALCAYGGLIVEEALKQRLAVVVSTDNGATWSLANSTIWACDDTGDYSFNTALSEVANTLTVNLSPYIGQSIRIAFYGESTTRQQDNYLYIDSICISESSAVCDGIRAMQIEQVRATSAVLSVLSYYRSDTIEYTFGLSGAPLGVNPILRITDTTSFALTDLLPAETYDVYARTLCATGDTSAWFGPVSFTTICLMEIPATYTFDDPNQYYVLENSLAMENCWQSPEASVCVMSNNDDHEFGLNGTPALYLVSDANAAYPDAIVVSPYIDAALDSLQLRFWGRPGYKTSKFGRPYIGEASSNSKRSVIVGTMVEPNDVSTFVPMDTITMPAMGVSDYCDLDSEGTEYYREFTYLLKGVPGHYIAFRSVNTWRNVFCIDEVTIEPLRACERPSALTANVLSATSAVAAWEGQAETYLVELTDEQGRVSAFSTAETSYRFTDLLPYSAYTVRVCAQCGNNGSVYTASVSFVTHAIEPFREDFEVPAKSWKRGEALLSDVLNGQAIEPTLYKWNVVDATATEANLSGKVAKVNLHGDEIRHWYISPTIYLSETTLDADSYLSLSLDVALSTFTDHEEVDADLQQEDKFALLISEDNGATWKADNMILWDNTPQGDHLLNALTPAGETFRLDVTRFVGKDIRLALYVESTDPSGKAGDVDLFVDNIRLRKAHRMVYAAQQCNATGYYDAYFSIQQQDLQIGTTRYERILPAESGEATDTLVQMNLTIYPTEHTLLYDTVCEGTHYTAHNFNLIANKSMVVPVRYTSVNGCDSLVELHLHVLPTTYADTTIYACTEYTFRNQVYHHDIILTDTLPNAAGCDSIRTTAIFFSPESEYTIDWRSVICTGTAYDDMAFHGLTEAGTYTATVSTLFGCDSTIHLQLLVADEARVAYDTVMQSELPYIFEGEPIIGEHASVGEYEHDVRVECGIITLQILVTEKTGVANTKREENAAARKILCDGQVYILRADKTFTLLGTPTNSFRNCSDVE